MFFKIIFVFAVIASNHLLLAKTVDCDVVKSTEILIGADVSYHPVVKGTNCFSFEFKSNQNQTITTTNKIPIEINFIEILDEFQILQNISGPIDANSELQNITEINAIYNYCNNINGYEKIWTVWTQDWVKIGVDNLRPLIERNFLKKSEINFIELRNTMNFSCIKIRSCNKCPAFFSNRNNTPTTNSISENKDEVNR